MGAALRQHWFLLGLLASIGGGFLLPQLPLGGSRDTLTLALVAGIFLASGLALRTRELVRGLGHWRLHTFVQSLNLGLLPLLCWGLDGLWQAWGLDAELRLGLFVLGALPTTVTSCVAFTVAAGGNQAGALVNAVLGNLLGLLLTPLWLLLFVGVTGEGRAAIEPLVVLQRLGVAVVLPVVAGQCLQAALGERLGTTGRGRAGLATQALLLVMLFFSFNAEGAGGDGIGAGHVLATLLICSALHAVALLLPWSLASLPGLRLDAADRRCALFCASQKTLALGLPLVAVGFAGHPAQAVILLPLLLYHPLQLIVAGLLVDRLQERKT